jgi:putative transposase
MTCSFSLFVRASEVFKLLLHAILPSYPPCRLNTSPTVSIWKQALFIVQPDTLLRWHRELFRLVWKRRSKAASHTPKIAAETVALIKEMAVKNRLWGAERIRGELLKLGIHVGKRTIQKYMRSVRTPQPGGQKWATFLHNHAADIWACDFLQVTDLFFRPLFAFFLIELKTRRVIHVSVTRSPTDPWVARTAARSHPVWASTEIYDL